MKLKTVSAPRIPGEAIPAAAGEEAPAPLEAAGNNVVAGGNHGAQIEGPRARRQGEDRGGRQGPRRSLEAPAPVARFRDRPDPKEVRAGLDHVPGRRLQGQRRCHHHRRALPRFRPRRRGRPQGQASSRSSGPSPPARPPSPSTSSPTPSAREGTRRSSTPSMPSIRSTPSAWASTWTRSSSRSPTRGSRPSRLPRSYLIERDVGRRDRLRGRARAEGGARGRDGGLPRRPPGTAHVAGPPEADRDRPQVEHVPDLHQPDPREDRGHVRQPGDDHGRPRAQVLLVRAARHPPPERHQGGGCA